MRPIKTRLSTTTSRRDEATRHEGQDLARRSIYPATRRGEVSSPSPSPLPETRSPGSLEATRPEGQALARHSIYPATGRGEVPSPSPLPQTRYPGDIRPRQRSQPLKMILMLGAFVLAVLYGTIMFSTGDALWFLKQFQSRPARIVVYHDTGKRTELRPGAPGFDLLADAIQASLAEGLERPSGIGLSDASLLDAYTRYVTVEAFFPRPVKLHAWFETGEPTRMLFPITGRHSELSLVVLGQGGKYLSSPPVLKTVQPLRDALHELGYYQ